LCDEGRALRVGRREIAEIVQTAFAHRDDLGSLQQQGQPLAERCIDALRMMRMNAGGAGENPR